MSAVKDILQYGTHAARPAAAASNDGKYYRETDTGSTYQSNGSTWVLVGSGAGAGTISGSTGSTDNAIIRADGTGGSTEQSSLATIDDSGTVNIPTGQTYNVNNVPHTHAGGGGAATTDHFVTTQTEGDLSAAIVIPGLAGSPDKKASGGSDDEFDATLSGWTTMGSFTTLTSNDTYKSHLYMKRTGGASPTADGVYKTAPGQPFTMTAKLSDMSQFANYDSVGIFVAEATPGKIDALVISYPGAPMCPGREQWSNPTTRTGSGTSYASSFGYRFIPIYLRIVVTSNTAVDFYLSQGGFFFYKVTTQFNPGFTIASAGLVTFSFTNALVTESVFDWVRFT
jgi:hypothetical protein